MREIVIGQETTGPGGISIVNVWFRVPVPAQRQPFYAAQNAGWTPLAPDSTGGKAYSSTSDQAEIAAFRGGSFVELSGFYVVRDPTWTDAQLGSVLVNVYNAAVTSTQNADASLLNRWATSWDGTSWTIKQF